MTSSFKIYLGLFVAALGLQSCKAQSSFVSLPYDQIYALCMDANVSPVVEILKNQGDLNHEDQEFKARFLKRFGVHRDSTQFSYNGLNTLITYFRDYWHKSLLNKGQPYERELMGKVVPYLMHAYPKIKEYEINPKNIEKILSDYIKSEGYHTRDRISKMGPLVDLAIWNKQEDSIYTVDLDGKKFEVKVFRLDDFLTLGWLEYATLGAHNPGGWTDDDGIYYVADSYDTDSEAFRVSLIAHEARHFLDQQHHPEMTNTMKEYRGKLTELSLAKSSLYNLISFFITNAVEDSEVAHSAANYQVVQDLSKTIFEQDFVSDLDRWKSVDIFTINVAANHLLQSKM